jgi:hypothetical protein
MYCRLLQVTSICIISDKHHVDCLVCISTQGEDDFYLTGGKSFNSVEPGKSSMHVKHTVTVVQKRNLLQALESVGGAGKDFYLHLRR